jgi:hypothetical protein
VPLGIRLPAPAPASACGPSSACGPAWTRFSLAPALLLLDSSLPGARAGTGGAGQGAARGEEPSSAEAWQRALRRAGEDPEAKGIGGLRAYYLKLATTLRRIEQAPDFRRLKEELTAFSKSLLNPSGWSPQELSYWQFALDTLDGLEEARAGVGALPAAPFRLWLGFLADSRYGAPVSEAGVNTYGYGVSAGIRPEHHFVIGASQAATRRVVKKLPGLGSHEEAALGELEHDLSDTGLALYARPAARCISAMRGRASRAVICRRASSWPPGR